MQKITVKSACFNLLKVALIIAFVVLFSQIFGSINTLTGISVLVALMSFWYIDIGINIKQAPFIILLLFLLTGISNQLAMLHPLAGLAINFTAIFLITYVPSSRPEYKPFMTFLLCYIFNQSNPAVGADFLSRMFSLFAGGLLVAGVYFFRHRKSEAVYGSVTQVFQNLDITSDTFILALKMAIGVSIAMLIGTLLDLQRTMWISISIMSLTQIDFKETQSRFKNRIIATLIGAVFFVVFFQVLIPAKYVFVFSFILSYIYAFLKEYKYQIVLITMNSLSSALALFDTSTAIRLRIGLILCGCMIGYVVNRIDFKKFFQAKCKRDGMVDGLANS